MTASPSRSMAGAATGRHVEVGRNLRDGGGVAEAFCADVTDEQQVAELVAAITGRFGPIDVLVLNATGPQPEAPVTDVAWAGHLAQLNFFVKSPVLLGRAVLPGMAARRYGRIVHIDSEVAHRPPPGRAAHADSPDQLHGPLLPTSSEAAQLWHDLLLIRFVAQQVLMSSSIPASW